MTQKPSICKPHGWSLGEINSFSMSNSCIYVKEKACEKNLDDESLLTLMTKVEGILNSWPLTVEMINHPSSFQQLAQANILTMKSKIDIPPPGNFLRPDLYCRRQWRQVQHIANEFWSHWRKEYLQSLREHQKWNTWRKNFVGGDIVLLKTMDVSRNKWPMAKVTSTKSDQNGLVQSLHLKISDWPEQEKAKKHCVTTCR